jgi:hypothetical protein
MRRWAPQTEYQMKLDNLLRKALSSQTKVGEQFYLFEELKKLTSIYEKTDVADLDVDGHFAYYIKKFISHYSEHVTVYGMDFYKDYLKTNNPKGLSNESIMRGIYRSVNDHSYLFAHLDFQQTKLAWPHIKNWMPENEFQIKLDFKFRVAFELENRERENAFIELFAEAAVMSMST